ncbi:LAFA_0E19548g1_1 [Lachancea sp. 'fantastica']|nr:LAFA_0E19548g1_1 [Lachancea sp. 'fantastica']
MRLFSFGTAKSGFRCSTPICCSRRLLTTSKLMYQREATTATANVISTRGKKLKPQKAQIVILGPREAGLVRKRKKTPAYFQRTEGSRSRERLSALQGVEFDESRLQRRNSGSSDASPADVLQEIESQRLKLLVFKNNVPKEQVIKSIHDLKPGSNSQVMSEKRYKQLKSLLEVAYTLPQLKEYAKQYHQLSMAKSTTKKAIISIVLNQLWRCQISESKSESEDLIVERIVDVQTRDIYLLLLTNNGKILQNFARLGATVAVALGENKIIVRATKALVKYVEVSLRKILDNVQREIISVDDLIQDHSYSSKEVISPSALVSLVQKESATFFEELPDENPSTYAITSFGTKRIRRAKNLLLWALDYNPQVSETVKFVGEQDRSHYMAFPFTEIDGLDWIRRKSDWFRLQKLIKKGLSPIVESALGSSVLTENKIDELFKDMTERTTTNGVPELKDAAATPGVKTWSVTLGHILTNESQTSTIFQSKVGGIVPKLMQLPLYDGLATQDELYTVDQHEYYVQMKLIPKIDSSVHARNIPPLELWFELDDNDKAINSSLRCLLHTEERNLLLETPHLSHDMKVTMDRTVEVTRPYDEAPHSWLEEQPGLKEFLLRARLTFQEGEKLSVPKQLTFNLHFKDRDAPEPVVFEYVNVRYHRILKLRLDDEYLVQFSDINGGSRGGRFKQVDFVKPDGGEITRQEFGQLISRVADFMVQPVDKHNA